MTELTDVLDRFVPATSAVRQPVGRPAPGRVGRAVAGVRAVPGAAVWAGVALLAAGVVLLTVSWGRTAGVTDVSKQIPLVLAFGFSGLGLVVVGLVALVAAAKSADSAERDRLQGELHGILVEIRLAVQEQPEQVQR